MVERTTDAAEVPLDVADRKMLAEIKASVLGTDRQDLFIGRFRVLERLGEGSMGAVFAAFDDQLKRRVALKLLHQGVGASDDERKARMLREAQVLAQLTHPNVVHVHEAGEHDGQIFMAMELVEGQTLDELQRNHSNGDWKKLLHLYVEAGRGLAAAHAKEVVHRDFKPHNVLVDTNGGVRVVDFGLARGSLTIEAQHTAEIPLRDEGAIERPDIDRLTATGTVPGTPAYMAPELFDGQPATAKSDQFSFCVALYEAIYGRRPFAGDRLQDVVSAAKHGHILPPPPERSAPRWVYKTITRGLAPNPADRYPSMDELLGELTRDRSSRRRWAWSSVGIVAVGVAAWWAGTRASAPRLVWPDAHLQARAAVEERRAQACGERAQNMKARWEAARQALSSQPAATGDADDLAAVLSVGATRFFEHWEQSCLADAEGTGESCRMRSERQLEGALALRVDHPLRVDAFYDLTFQLELCLEGGTSACGSSDSDSPAATALTAAQSAELTGALDAAMEQATQAVQLATSSSDRLTRLRAMLLQGAILESRGEVGAAQAILDRALVAALVCDADVLAVDIALEQAESEVLHSGNPERAEVALETAAELLAKSSVELPLRTARLLEKKGGTKLYLERRCTEGVAFLEDALSLREREIAKRRGRGLPTIVLDRLAADAQLNLANAQLYAALGYWEDCVPKGLDNSELLAVYRHARERFANAAGGGRQLGLAEYDFSYGAALLELGPPQDAAKSFASALAIYDAHHGPTSLLSADTHRALAAAHLKSGALEQAENHARANIAIRILHGQEEGQKVMLAEAHDTLGVIVHQAGRLDEARKALLAAIDVFITTPVGELTLKEHEQLRLSYVNLALVEWDRQDRAATKHTIREARALKASLAKRSDAEQPDLAPERLIEARLLLADGHARQALERLADAEQLPGASPPIVDAIAAARESATKPD